MHIRNQKIHYALSILLAIYFSCLFLGGIGFIVGVPAGFILGYCLRAVEGKTCSYCGREYRGSRVSSTCSRKCKSESEDDRKRNAKRWI